MNKYINKRDLVAWLKDCNPELSLSKLEEMVNAFFHEVAAALICGDRVELRGLGSMVVRKRTAKVARNPKTNQIVSIKDKGYFYFRPSKELIKLVNT